VFSCVGVNPSSLGQQRSLGVWFSVVEEPALLDDETP
jgi:hypothetical protein